MNRSKLLSLLLALTVLLGLLTPVLSVSAATAPAAPTLTVTQLAGKFALSWNTPANGGSAITSYSYVYYPSSEEGSDARTPVIVDASRGGDETPALDRYGEEYTFRFWATNAIGNSPETVVYAKLLHQNHITVTRVKDRLEAESFSATLQEAPNEEALKAFLEAQVAQIDDSVTASVNVSSFEAAQLTQAGEFQFTVSLSMGNPAEPSYASTITKTLKGVISSSGKLSTPKIAVTTSEEGGFYYQITTTGTAAQADAIQSFKITLYDVLNEQAALTDYTVNATEKSGTIPLSSGLKGESKYRAAVKACSADTLRFLDSDLSELSTPAEAGRIPITVRPSVTEKYYGDTEPIFGYEIVSGPNPLPSGVDLKLTFSRAEGTEVGTYAFTHQQTDTNYLVTMEAAVFEILPRPLSIRAADREVIFEEGTTWLLQGYGEADGLITGDVITALEFAPTDARGSVGSFEITPVRATVLSGERDVTKNYDITFLPGTLTVHPIGYTPEGESSFPLWILFVILAAVLLIAAVVILLLLLKKHKGDPEDDEPLPTEEATDGEQTPSASDGDYEEYLEIIDLESVEKEAEAEAEPTPADPPESAEQADETAAEDAPAKDEVEATIEQIETAQKNTQLDD